MGSIKRILLFLVINLLVITTISAIISLLHLEPFFSSYGINYSSLLIFCLVWGIAGSMISLLLSKHIAKWVMGVRIISSSSTAEEKELLHIVEELAKTAGLSTPEVGIYESNEVNAFATGPTKKRSLIAVSTGLLSRMEQNEIRAVLAHEMSHISNGDMVTMTLLQGIINAFVMFLARVLAFFIATSGKEKNSNNFSYLTYTLLVFLFQTIFTVLGFIALAAFSRRREYRADEGGARLAGRSNMIDALKTLRVLQEIKDPLPQQQAAHAINSLKISNFSKKGLSLFATHPPLEKRIEHLKNYF
jgi:heat shock protein HtpX